MNSQNETTERRKSSAAPKQRPTATRVGQALKFIFILGFMILCKGISRNSETESLHWASIEKNEEIEFLGLSQITWIMTMLVTLSMKGESRFLDPT